MASIKNVSITKGKTYTFRLYVLLYDIGGPVLRDLIRRLIYPDTLEARLTARHYYLLDLNTKKKLIDEYYHKLFPDGKAATSSDVFDLTLLIYLLRAVCDLRHSSDGVWSKMPANNDTTPEANITRLKLYRNAIFHEASTDVFSRDNGFTEEENFAAVWDTVKAAILDLDNGSSPGLRSKIDSLCKEAIDSSTEEEFRQEKERWRQQIHYNVTGLTELMIASLDGKQFVKTNSFNEAHKKLIQKRIVVLKGNPGEGKTTMSRMLAREVGNGKCVNLSTPSDWRNVNVTEHIVIIIDDIFGASVLDVNEFRRWHKVLTEIETAVQTKGNKLHIIVTSRNYILNEALQRMYCPTFFTAENTVKLSSEQLSYREKEDILECHLKMEVRDCSKEFVQKCVQCRKELAEETQSFPIGFPECARLFCQREDLYQKGQKFFQQPLHFIKEHIRTVFGEDELTFLAYFLVWAQENQELSIQDIELPIHATPDSVLSVIKSLQFSPEHCLRKIGQCLIEHRDGFLNFDNNTGMYQFSHKVVADVVGLIAFERNTTAVLTSCDFDFAMRYIRTENTQQDTLYVSPYRYSRLSVKLVEFLTIEANQIDGSVIQHEAFRNKTFCNTFFETQSIQLDLILVVPVQSLSTVFMQYDIELKYDKSRLASFSLFKGNGKSVFAELCFQKSIIPKEVLEEELYLSTMIAIRFGVIDTLVWLSEHGTKVTDEMIILAAKEEKHDVIKFLQRKCDKNEADVSLGWNKKSKQNPILWMVQNGASIAVSLLLSRHNDFKYVKIKNKSCTALHVACHFGSAEIAGMILDNYSYLDHENEHGYHPIHIAAKKGHTETVMALLEKKTEAQICKILTLPKKDNIKGLTLLHVAIWVDNDELAGKLVKTGFFARKLDALQRTALVFALNGRKHRCIKQLLKMDEIDKEMPDLDGNTPLHIAILKANHESSYVEYAKALCDKVDVNIQNKDGDTALHFAYATKESEIRNKLLENPNIKRNIKNKQDRIPSQVLQLSTNEECEQDVNEDDV